MPSSPGPFSQPALQALSEALHTPATKPFVVGPYGSSLAWVITFLAQHLPLSPSAHSTPHSKTKEHKGKFQPWLIITPTDQDAERLYQDLQFFHVLNDLPPDRVAFFPHRGSVPYDTTPPSVDLVAQRMRSLFHLTQSHPTILVASVRAALQRLLPFSLFSESCLSLRRGSVIEREPLTRHLLRLGYRRVSVVDIPGEFSVRGGIVDIFSTAYPYPLRVEFLGDTVESTRLFDTTTQESFEPMAEAWILPAREYIQSDGTGSTSSNDVPPEIQPDAEWWSPHLYPQMATLVDYFPDPSMVVLDRPMELGTQAREFWEHLLEIWEQQETASSSPGSYPEPDHLYLIWEELLESLGTWPTLGTAAIPPGESSWQPMIPIQVQSTTSVGLGLRGTTFTETLTRLEQLRHKGMVVVVVRNQGQVGRLLALFAEHHTPAMAWKPGPGPHSAKGRAPFFIVQGDLSTGFVSQDGPLAMVTEDELFAKAARHRPQQKSKTATFLSSLDDLNVHDLVVHVQYGISRYRGLRRLSVQGFESDYLSLQFAGADTLYVPLDRLNQVQRYRGAENHTPKLDKLGGTSWARTTAKVKKGIEDMAQELVELYASREIVERKAYLEDTTLTHEFEVAFEYEETSDQLGAIQEIQRDMESSKPMDRLVCGDVGYGKTEVAMRAAFKAVQDNRQVAILVPTTLLAQQHYETFCRRFAAFPVRIAVLSRFQTAKEVKAILPDLASGLVDIVIGTHRLLQKDVLFKTLGLVIVDEEQWFGVRHKERLKQLRTQVDVLTLTATPIPRTLQMAFSGVRDLSVMDTPPPGRLAIQTQVLRFDPTIVQNAIRRELARAGQVFYVHNRVQTMERAASWLKELVPEAQIVMAHGQMDERLLESAMLKFFHGEADVLVASAIIQSGLDLPRANTILVDRADTFGLAQLYQLRGRVGRAGDQAYAYFFFPNEEILSTDAQKRLMAIQEFADLGSGFRIAAADLEIRGSGNLLGKQQSGNIAAVGLDLYLKMVEQAVQHHKGQEVEEELDPALHLNVSAYFPEEYVEDGHQRLSLYKRLSASQKIGDLALLHGEIQDRYGPLPEPVERLFEVMQIKLLAKQVGLESVGANAKCLSLNFAERTAIPETAIQWLLDSGEYQIQFTSPRACEIYTGHEDWPLLVQELTQVLQGLKDQVTQPVGIP